MKGAEMVVFLAITIEDEEDVLEFSVADWRVDQPEFGDALEFAMSLSEEISKRMEALREKVDGYGNG